MFISEYSVWLSAAHKRYMTAKKRLEASSEDPPNEPYKSKYAAGAMFSQIKTEMETNCLSNQMLQFKVVHALLNYELGVIAVETEEKSTGLQLITKCFEEVADIKEKPECCFLTLCALNHLGVLWSEREEFEKALCYLLEAEALYARYKRTNENCPFVCEDTFLLENSGKSTWSEFENKFTYTCYFLGQLYGHMDDIERAACYLCKTLKRQKESGDYETINWVDNCILLSIIYLGRRQYQETRHLLACATHVLLKYEMKVETEGIKDARTSIHKSKASLSGCWVKYAIAVLSDVKKEDKDMEESFRLFEDETVLAMEKKISCTFKSYEDAKHLFIFAQNHISVAQSFFTLNEYASNYAQITQNHSKLYGALATLDQDTDRNCKMLKRRTDMLEELLNKLNPTYYLSICRQLQFELGEIYYEMVILKAGGPFRKNKAPKVIAKCNMLTMKGMGHLNNYIGTFRDKEGKLPEVFSDDVVRPALIAHFYIGKYYSGIVEPNAEQSRHNMAKCIENYEFIINYIERNPQHISYIEDEFSVIEEFIGLMSEKC